MVEHGFELSEASEYSGDAGAAHPCVSRVRLVHCPRQPTPPLRREMRSTTRRAT